MGYLSCKAQSSVSVSNSHHNHNDPSPSPFASPHQKNHANCSTHPATKSPIQEFDYRDLQVATNNFSEKKLLGRGSHGVVYKAVLRSGRSVAVKKPSQSRRPTDSPTEFDNEFHILSNLRSPSFVNLVGYTSSPIDRLLVIEFMSNGTLYDVLHKNPKPPSWGRRLRLALQTAKAIQTLHSQHPPVIHRDIKSANVLIDRNHNARLSDFGLALRCHVDGLPSTPPAGTMGYLDPLYVTPDNLSTKTDVFSFGILLLEIVSGRKAIDVGYSPPSIVDWAVPLIRKEKVLSIFDPRIPPPRDPVVCKQLAVIAAKCVRYFHQRRPSMKEVVRALDGLAKLVPVRSSWNGLGNPCLMVDTVLNNNPVESGSVVHFPQCGNLDDAESTTVVNRQLRSSKRVHTGLRFRSNLKELMAKPDDGEEEENGSGSGSGGHGLSFRVLSELVIDRKSGAIVQLRRNKSSSRGYCRESSSRILNSGS